GEDEKREVLRWLFFDNHEFTSYFATWRFMKSFATKPCDPAVAAFLQSRIDSAFSVVEKHLAGREYIVGSALTIADISLSGYLFYPADESGYVLEERFPNLAAWRDRLKAAPGWGDPYQLSLGERVAPRW
ncbi:MAG: glutathione binding-like protein, partial [Caldimonas sp.]